MKKARLLSVLIMLTSLMMLNSCTTTFKASSDFDQSHSFVEYKTFAWISDHPMKDGTEAGIRNPLLEGKIMAAIERGLTGKGYRLVDDAESADFALAFTVGSREQIRVDTYPSMSGVHAGYPRHWGWGRPYYGTVTETSVRQYTEGVLALDVFDVDERRPVWHGAASKSISNSDRKKTDETVQAAVTAVLSEFPPY